MNTCRINLVIGFVLCLVLAIANNKAWSSYADVVCTNPAGLTVTPTGSGGYTTNGPKTIDCTLTTDTGNGSVVATLSGADYNTSNGELTLHHTGNGSLTLVTELTNAIGFASNGLPLSGTLTPGSPSQTPTDFSYDVDVKNPGSITAYAGGYSATLTVTISSY